MWTWIWLLLLPIIILLLIEEGSQFIWRRYLKNPQERNDTFLIRTFNSIKKIQQKYRKDSSH
ncbi:hypothetical protein G3A_04065 [Bacillus sp. 17376]|uniref:Uncharacterized protein n=1 Tax=Mesobacillus boroniphilus JCM 21738 TaxID=1294265 RepID=W4RM42_9BACI|nr:hypothetical protein G3A_04065 [Bacillus sp. 17376]GAE44923.1 hypothetical protein JCM21738_1678 [Mesobacillus boroniphilus JCM 21738]